MAPASEPGPRPPPRADRPTEVQKFHANIVLAFFGSCVLAIVVLVIQHGFQRTDRAMSANETRLEILGSELFNFAETFHRVIRLAHEGSLWKVRYMSKPIGESATRETPWAKDREEFMTWQDVYERMTKALDALEEEAHPDVLCHRLQIYLANQEADHAVETLRKSVSHLMFFCEKEPGLEQMDGTEREARLNAHMETVNRDWDTAITALKSEFVSQ